MESLIVLLVFIMFMAGFMRIDSNVIKISQSLEHIEELLSKDKEKK